MATYRGLVHTVHIRDDGWVEVIIQAVHAGNTTQTFFIKDLDGDISVAHKRLAQLSLLRDAILRILPVEIDYSEDAEEGRIIHDVTIHPRPSIDSYAMINKVKGVVIGISLAELGPTSGVTPYKDPADLAGITLLQEDGTVSLYMLDLQRTEKLTMHAMLALLQMAHTTRRPVELVLGGKKDDRTSPSNPTFAANRTPGGWGYIIACQWVTVPEEMLDYAYAFIERLGQRYESYEMTEAKALSHMKVLYTTAPAQTPEGDISENGSFTPEVKTAWVHDNSPLLKLLRLALKNQLQVKIGLLEDWVHEVEVISHIGSAARPLWICVRQVYCDDLSEKACNNTPTIGLLNKDTLAETPISLTWKAQGYFNEGVWRFHIDSTAKYQLMIDGKSPCCKQLCKESCCCQKNSNTNNERSNAENDHLYLKGLHTIELKLTSYHQAQPFDLKIYRIR